MSKFYVVSSDILPEVLEKVIEARSLLQKGKVKRISEAVKQVGISRGTYYKYKDTVFAFDQEKSRRKAVVSMILRSETGSLSKVISLLANNHVNILAINQTVPINGIHNVSFTLDVADSDITIGELVKAMEEMPVVEKADLVAVE